MHRCVHHWDRKTVDAPFHCWYGMTVVYLRAAAAESLAPHLDPDGYQGYDDRSQTWQPYNTTDWDTGPSTGRELFIPYLIWTEVNACKSRDSMDGMANVSCQRSIKTVILFPFSSIIHSFIVKFEKTHDILDRDRDILHMLFIASEKQSCCQFVMMVISSTGVVFYFLFTHRSNWAELQHAMHQSPMEETLPWVTLWSAVTCCYCWYGRMMKCKFATDELLLQQARERHRERDAFSRPMIVHLCVNCKGAGYRITFCSHSKTFSLCMALSD